MNRGKRRQAGRTPNASRGPRRSATARQRLECVELAPAFAGGSWRASLCFCACIGTLNPPLAPPRRGTDRTPTDACSPPGKGRGWVGSWKGKAIRRHSEVFTLLGGVRFTGDLHSLLLY